MQNSTVLILFARSVRPGLVKTRLMPPLNGAQAVSVYQRLLGATVARVRQMPFAARVLAVHPDEHCSEMSAAYPGFDLVIPQGAGDLGQKITRAVACVQERYGGGVIAIGADAPDLPQDRFSEACEQVALGRCVLCPGSDGGYCLIAMPTPQPALFEGIDWGTSRVARQTREAAGRQGIVLSELAGWHDVDTVDDLARLVERIGASDDPHLIGLRRELISLKLPNLTPEPDC